MCIILAKPKGAKLPSKQVLTTCFENNPDGAGIMFAKNNQVRILKGYMTIEELLKGLDKVKRICKSDLTDQSIVIHFRIGTHGKNDKATTHPFPITSNYNDLRKTNVTSSLGLAHNGVISSYYYDNVLSDTQAFVKDFLAPIKDIYKEFYKDDRFKRIILKSGGYSKFAILDSKGYLTILGDFIQDNGVYYSNGSYKEARTKWQPKSPSYTYSYNYNNKTSSIFDKWHI